MTAGKLASQLCVYVIVTPQSITVTLNLPKSLGKSIFHVCLLRAEGLKDRKSQRMWLEILISERTRRQKSEALSLL